MTTSEALHYPPQFQVGDKVVSFRGETGTILSILPSGDRRKSHKYMVEWDPGQRTTLRGPYYESVFELQAEASAIIQALANTEAARGLNDTYADNWC